MPLKRWPLNSIAPAALETVTLCGMASSWLVNAIRSGVPAGADNEAGENRKSRASMASVTGVGVGGTVGLAVGFRVGFGVGLMVGLAVRVGAGVGGRVGAGVGVRRAVAVGVAVAVGAGVGTDVGDADGLGERDGGSLVGASDGSALTTANDADGTAPTVGAADRGTDGLVTDVPQAATGRHRAASRRPAADDRLVRETGTAAL